MLRYAHISITLNNPLSSKGVFTYYNVLRWCTGARPIPVEIPRTYEEDDKWGYMETEFYNDIIQMDFADDTADMSE